MQVIDSCPELAGFCKQEGMSSLSIPDVSAVNAADDTDAIICLK
jgi:hypothetical protein